MKKKLQNKLVKIGFSEKESKVYLLLLEFGSCSTSFVAKKAKMNRGTTYTVLHMLLEKGLVTKTTKQKVNYFAPLEPSRLLKHLELREKEFVKQKNIAAEMLEELDAIRPQHIFKPKVQYFTGVEGVRAALEDTLVAKEETLRTYSATSDMDEFLGADYFGGEYTRERIGRGYFLQSVQSLEKDKEALTRESYIEAYGPSVESRRDTRYIKSELVFPMTMYIYDDKVLVISSLKENFALITQSQEYAEMQKKIFYEVWNSLEVSDVFQRKNSR